MSPATSEWPVKDYKNQADIVTIIKNVVVDDDDAGKTVKESNPTTPRVEVISQKK